MYSPIEDVSVEKQQYKNAVERYKLLYKYKPDSLLYKFQKLDTLFKRYNVETYLNPKQINKDAFYFRDHKGSLNEIRNQFDRKTLSEKFQTLNRLFYEPNYLHPSIIGIYFAVIIIVWLFGFLLYILWNYKNKKSVNSSN